MIDFGLRDRGALVSGAGYLPERAGHGRLCSLILAEAGASVACVDIDTGRAVGTVDAIEAAGGTAFPITADMTDPVQVQRAVDEAAEALGSIDVCVDIIGGATWDGVQGEIIDREPVTLDAQHSVHRYLRFIEKTVAGFYWTW